MIKFTTSIIVNSHNLLLMASYFRLAADGKTLADSYNLSSLIETLRQSPLFRMRIGISYESMPSQRI